MFYTESIEPIRAANIMEAAGMIRMHLICFGSQYEMQLNAIDNVETWLDRQNHVDLLTTLF